MQINNLLFPLVNAINQFITYTKQALNKLISALAQSIFGQVPAPNPQPMSSRSVTIQLPNPAAKTSNMPLAGDKADQAASIVIGSPSSPAPVSASIIAPVFTVIPRTLITSDAVVAASSLINITEICTYAKTNLDAYAQLVECVNNFTTLPSEQKDAAYKLRLHLLKKIRALLPHIELLASKTTDVSHSGSRQQALELKNTLSSTNRDLTKLLNKMQSQDPRWQLYQLIETDEYLNEHTQPSDFDDCVEDFENKVKRGELNLDLIKLLPIDQQIASDDVKTRCEFIIHNRHTLIARLKTFTNILDGFTEGSQAEFISQTLTESVKMATSYDDELETVNEKIKQLTVAQYKTTLDRFEELFPSYQAGSNYSKVQYHDFSYRLFHDRLIEEFTAVMKKTDLENGLDRLSTACLMYRCACNWNPDGTTYQYQTSGLTGGDPMRFIHRASLRRALENLIARHSVPKLEKDPGMQTSKDVLKALTEAIPATAH